MKVSEIVQRLKRKPQKKAITATQADVEYFANLYARYLNRLESIPSFVPQNPPTAGEMKIISKVDARKVHPGEETRLAV